VRVASAPIEIEDVVAADAQRGGNLARDRGWSLVSNALQMREQLVARSWAQPRIDAAKRRTLVAGLQDDKGRKRKLGPCKLELHGRRGTRSSKLDQARSSSGAKVVAIALELSPTLFTLLGERHRPHLRRPQRRLQSLYVAGGCGDEPDLVADTALGGIETSRRIARIVFWLVVARADRRRLDPNRGRGAQARPPLDRGKTGDHFLSARSSDAAERQRRSPFAGWRPPAD
jgi:hypothetical protein